MSHSKKAYAAPAVMSLAIAGVIAMGGASSEATARANKVELCHMPGTAAAHVISVPEQAVSAHLGHGDFLLGGKGKGKGKGSTCD